MTAPIRLHAHGKVNLLLRVLGKETDGYHDIETLFCRISLHDELELAAEPAPGVRLEVSGGDTGPLEQNLAYRAARMVLEATGNRFGVRMALTKRIPTRAGLGGGSSDGATALQGVNQLANHAVPRHELLQFAARLGSDVPFFLSGASLALAWGRGERMLRLPALPTHPALLLLPPVGVSTAEAYQWVDSARESIGRRGAVALDLDSLSDWGSIARLAGNDFESAVFAKHPEVREAFERLAGTHPLLCRMSGSGSALFAVYRSPGDRDDAAMMLGKKLGEVVRVEVGER